MSSDTSQDLISAGLHATRPDEHHNAVAVDTQTAALKALGGKATAHVLDAQSGAPHASGGLMVLTGAEIMVCKQASEPSAPESPSSAAALVDSANGGASNANGHSLTRPATAPQLQALIGAGPEALTTLLTPVGHSAVAGVVCAESHSAGRDSPCDRPNNYTLPALSLPSDSTVAWAFVHGRLTPVVSPAVPPRPSSDGAPAVEASSGSHHGLYTVPETSADAGSRALTPGAQECRLLPAYLLTSAPEPDAPRATVTLNTGYGNEHVGRSVAVPALPMPDNASLAVQAKTGDFPAYQDWCAAMASASSPDTRTTRSSWDGQVVLSLGSSHGPASGGVRNTVPTAQGSSTYAAAHSLNQLFQTMTMGDHHAQHNTYSTQEHQGLLLQQQQQHAYGLAQQEAAPQQAWDQQHMTHGLDLSTMSTRALLSAAFPGLSSEQIDRLVGVNTSDQQAGSGGTAAGQVQQHGVPSPPSQMSPAQPTPSVLTPAQLTALQLLHAAAQQRDPFNGQLSSGRLAGSQSRAGPPAFTGALGMGTVPDAMSPNSETCGWDDLTQAVKEQIKAMITRCDPYIKLVHFDGGVRHWLQQLTMLFGEGAALSGLAAIEGATNLAGVRNMRAFVTTRLIDHFESFVFTNDPVSYAAKRLLPEQFIMIAQVIAEGNGLKWEHFDPKVLETIRDMPSVDYTRARLQRLTAKELAAVQNIPAYIFTLLSKRGKTAKQAAAAKGASEAVLSAIVDAAAASPYTLAANFASNLRPMPGFTVSQPGLMSPGLYSFTSTPCPGTPGVGFNTQSGLGNWGQGLTSQSSPGGWDNGSALAPRLLGGTSMGGQWLGASAAGGAMGMNSPGGVQLGPGGGAGNSLWANQQMLHLLQLAGGHTGGMGY